VRTDQAIVAGARVSHEEATLDELEAAAMESDDAALDALLERPGVREAFVLQTCNRVEAYVVTDSRDAGREAVQSLFSHVDSAVVTQMGHEESIRHLLRVAAGLESLVVGEDQILGQVRDAYGTAQESDAVGPILEDAVTKAIRVGERARTETAINDGVVSLASAAVKLTEETHGLRGASAVVIGVGEMGTLAARRLDGRVDTLVVANRTPEKASRLAGELGTEGTRVKNTGLDDLRETVATHDVVISATGSDEWILDPEDCRSLGQTLIVDITRPRDIPDEADQMDHLTVYDLDRLEAVTEKTRQMRRDAAEDVTDIIDTEFERLLAQYKRKRADAVISAMYESAERIKATELETIFEKGDFDADQREFVEAMADSLVSQLLAPPTNSLRDAAEDDDWSTIHTALQLFDPNFEGEMDGPKRPSGPEDAPTAIDPGDIPADVDIEEMATNPELERMPEAIRERLPESDFGSTDD
jgi:glutamyl-tRNA reductase